MSSFGAILPACATQGDYTCVDKVFSGFTGAGGTARSLSVTELTDQHRSLFVVSGGDVSTAFSEGYSAETSPGFLAGKNNQIQASIEMRADSFASDVERDFNAAAKDTLANASSGLPASGAVLPFTSPDFIVNPAVVPEPMTLVLIGSGLLGIGLLGRRKAVKG